MTWAISKYIQSGIHTLVKDGETGIAVAGALDAQVKAFKAVLDQMDKYPEVDISDTLARVSTPLRILPGDVEEIQEKFEAAYQTCKSILELEVKPLSRWQPISTAPFDEIVLVRGKSGYRSKNCQYYMISATLSRIDKQWRTVSGDWLTESYAKPTDWMEIPE